MKQKSIVTLACFALMFVHAQSPAQPTIFPQPLSPRIANYDIDVKLDTKTRMLHAHEVLTWFNKTPDVITEMPFHLYLNAFRNDKSTFMKESGGSMRGSKIDKEGWGYSEVTKISLASGEDLTASMQFIQPDDGNTDDKTVFRIPLPKPIKPGESIQLAIDFDAKLPQPPFARTGAKDEYFFVGQWFPKPGVYIDGKWNCHQFHAYSEFFADFGVYNVRMTVPEKNIVGGTGQEWKVVHNNDGTATHFYHAEDVIDFAWTTSPEFVEFKGRAENVDIRVLMQPDHVSQGQRHVDAAKTGIEYFHKWYGNYPYPNLTVVDPRRGAGSSGGMEYPTLITAGTAYGIPDGLRLVEMVIIHEFGHQYWYGMVATNEFEESWMDEGINSYSESQIMNAAYGPTGDAIDLLGFMVNDLQYQRSSYIFFPRRDTTVRYAWKYYSGGSYAINSYTKPAVLLTTLHNYLGKETMLKVMRTYKERWQFKHPHTKDFIDVANEVTGQDLSWYFNQALFSNAKLDYSIDKVSTKEVQPLKGYDFSLAIGDTTNHNEKDTTTSSEPKMYQSEVNVRRLGDFVFPVEIEAVFENGDTVHEQWDGRDLWKKYTYVKPTRLVSATVDPDHTIPLDVNYTNNSMTVETQGQGINKLSSRILFWAQMLFDQPDLLNLVTFLQNAF